MLSFSGPYYLFFLIIVLMIYWPLKGKPRFQNIFLVLVSFLFYTSFSYKLTILLGITLILDYWFLGKIKEGRNKGVYLGLSLLINLLPLLLIKIKSAFFPHIIETIIIPIGVSFYTFKAMSFAIDTYRGNEEEIPDFVEYALFVSFFPALLCGPISRFHEFKENFKGRNSTLVIPGFLLFIRGMAKKILIADVLLNFIRLTEKSSDQGAIQGLILLVSNIFFVTADFSGYTDMARGSAQMLGFHLPQNFRLSLFAKDIGDFWRRHHMTMSQWFRDYVYYQSVVKLTRNFSSFIAVLGGTLISFLCSGLWHSFSWQGILFGLLQSFAFFLLLKLPRMKALHFILLWIVNAISFGLLLLKSEQFENQIAGHIFSFQRVSDPSYLYLVIFSVLYLIMDYFFEKYEERLMDKVPYAVGILYSVILLLIIIFNTKNVDFVYYQF